MDDLEENPLFSETPKQALHESSTSWGRLVSHVLFDDGFKGHLGWLDFAVGEFFFLGIKLQGCGKKTHKNCEKKLKVIFGLKNKPQNPKVLSNEQNIKKLSGT